MGQISMGRLARPERQEPGDVVRSTASLHYTRPGAAGDWSSSLVWGRNHKVLNGRNSNALLLESVYPLTRKNLLTGRLELVDKDELFPGREDSYRIGAYTLGYTRDIATVHQVETGIGANVTAYSLPAAIKPAYGDHPLGVSIYLRMRLAP